MSASARSRETRKTVLRALQAFSEPVQGRALAEATKLPYKAVIDALQALCNNELVWRIGRKSTARWTANPPAPQNRAATHLDALFSPLPTTQRPTNRSHAGH